MSDVCKSVKFYAKSYIKCAVPLYFVGNRGISSN